MDEILDEKTYETRELKYAPFSLRTAAFLMDILLLVLITFVVYYGFGLASAYKEFLQMYWWQLIGIVSLYFIYYDGSEQNATIGKQIFSIRLLNGQKRDVDFTTSAKHFFLSIVLFFGYFLLLSKESNRTLADKISKVFVVKVK